MLFLCLLLINPVFSSGLGSVSILISLYILCNFSGKVWSVLLLFVYTFELESFEQFLFYHYSYLIIHIFAFHLNHLERLLSSQRRYFISRLYIFLYLLLLMALMVTAIPHSHQNAMLGKGTLACRSNAEESRVHLNDLTTYLPFVFRIFPPFFFSINSANTRKSLQRKALIGAPAWSNHGRSTPQREVIS